MRRRCGHGASSRVIVYSTASIFDAGAEALVNPVNCVGVMEGGIAAEFKRRWPAMFDDYKAACDAGEVRPGRCHVWRIAPAEVLGPSHILNLPTNRHWRDQSRLADIRAGLRDLVKVVASGGIRSVALPALWTGLGGLDWADVRALIEDACSDMGQHTTATVCVPRRLALSRRPGQPTR